MPHERSMAEELDRADSLAGYRERFVIPDPDVIYLAGNSLGRMPKAGAAAVEAAMGQWAERMIGGWENGRWLDLPSQIGDAMAGPVLGAGPGQVIVSDSTSVNLYKLASAALSPGGDQRVVITDAGDFPTDRYVLGGLRARTVLIHSDPVAGPSASDVSAALDESDGVDLVCLSHINYRSGSVADMVAITAAVHDAGALVLWDLSHSAGCYPIDLDRAGVDLATGCTYKYLCAGPGAPAFLYVRRDLQPRLRQPIWGWFGQRDQFVMGPDYQPWPDVRQFLAGTPSVLALAGVQGGVEVVTDAGIPAIRAKARALGALAMELYRGWLPPLGFTLGSPADGRARGSHLALRHADAHRLHRDLGRGGRVITDFRFPDSIRIGMAPLTTRFVDVWDAFNGLRELTY